MNDLIKATRYIEDHKVNPGNDRLAVAVLDRPGQGNACHEYEIRHGDEVFSKLSFQNGPINVDGNGVNGITHEALIAVVIDRLRGFQSGPYACRENEQALTRLEEAQHWLQQRTLARMRRGVEGTHTA